MISKTPCPGVSAPVVALSWPQMKLRIAWIGKTKESAIQTLTAEYLKRLSRYVATEGLELGSEEALLKLMDRSGRTAPVLVLMDQRGKQVSSEELANFL